jgi:CDP-paratose 2-epimerase
VRILVTGSSGLIGSEAVAYFDREGHEVVGVDNNMRREFFGAAGDTLWNLDRLKSATKRFKHVTLDIRDRAAIEELFRAHRFELIVHCAAQPSHDKAREIPLVDFEVNALGTIQLLEATRQHCPDAVFVFLSTNKVYGDAPNEIPLIELETRYDYAMAENFDGVDETCRIDRTLHSLFGASKAAADLAAQEYGRYFGMKVGVFRGGCLTGPSHSGVELHGFLSYLVKVTLSGGTYSVSATRGSRFATTFIATTWCERSRNLLRTHGRARSITWAAADKTAFRYWKRSRRSRNLPSASWTGATLTKRAGAITSAISRICASSRATIRTGRLRGALRPS